jgi:hypothetical protein
MSHEVTLGASILALVLLGSPTVRGADKVEATDRTQVVTRLEPSTPIELPESPARPSEDELVGGFVGVVVTVGVILFVILVAFGVTIVVCEATHHHIFVHDCEECRHHAPPPPPPPPPPPVPAPRPGSGS